MEAKIGLALGGGGARGLAHIGVLRVLEREGIPLSCIAGSSMGAIIGGAYAYWQNSDAVEEFIKELIEQSSFQNILHHLSYLFGESGHEHKESFFTYLKSRLSLLKAINNNALLDNQTVKAIFEFFTDKAIENLPLKFCAIATDLLSGQEIVLDKGSLKKALMASSAIPVIFPPVEQDGCLLVDGSTSDSVPVHILKERGANRVVAVNVTKCIRKIVPLSNAMHIMYRADEIATFHLTMERLAGADFVIRPNVGGILWYNFRKYKDIIALGEQATKEALPDIKRLLKINIKEMIKHRFHFHFAYSHKRRTSYF